MRTTHTLATMQVLPSTYAEIRGRLERAGYSDQILPGTGHLDMTGIALEARPEPVTTSRDDVVKKIRDGYYGSSDECLGSAEFRRDTLQILGLDDHPKAMQIYAFACVVGAMADWDQPAQVWHALQQIAAFMK